MSPFSAADKCLCESHHLFSRRRHSPLLVCRPAAEPAELIIPLDENIQTVAAPFLCVNSLCPLLLMSFEFSLPKILPCPLFFSFLQHHLLQGLMGAQQYKFPFIPVAGADDTAAFTPQIDEPSDADLLYMAATLEPPHIWSGVRLLKNWGQPWPKQV